MLVALAGIVPVLIMRGVFLNSYEKCAVRVRTAEIQNQCTILSNQLSSSGYLTGDISEVMRTELVQLSNIYSGRVMVIDGAFKIQEDTYDMDKGQDHRIRQCNPIVSKTKEPVSITEKTEYIEVTAPIIGKDDAVVGVLLVSAPTDSVLDSLEILRNKADVVALATILVIMMIAVLAGIAMLKPFRRITESISAVTEGYDDNYLHENTYTETIELSEAFNKMSGRMKTLDDSKNEFVSNVSHELKTPLTSMKVLADSLLLQEDAPVELYKEFMGDMSEEIERENKIINDLLSLVKMDKTANNANTMNIKSENMNELVEKILKRLRPIAATRNIELVYESIRPVTAEVDEMKISLAISNLVENAIKYNKDNGWVHVTLNADHKNCYIEVADSGIGIPAEAQEHIFERFYRVDKSHSREIGGTGLGLAIARSAVVMHRGAIKVFSQPSEGTTFTVRIPLNYVS